MPEVYRGSPEKIGSDCDWNEGTRFARPEARQGYSERRAIEGGRLPPIGPFDRRALDVRRRRHARRRRRLEIVGHRSVGRAERRHRRREGDHFTNESGTIALN